MSMTDQEFTEELNNYPDLKNRFKEILRTASNKGEKLITLADDAEDRVVDQMRDLGKETLENWAKSEAVRVSGNVKSQIKSAKKHSKKN